jgi:hypothetical protein
VDVRRVVFLVAVCLLLSSCFLYFFRDDSLGGWEIVGEQYFPEQHVHSLDLVSHPSLGLMLVIEFMTQDYWDTFIRVYRYEDGEWVVYTDDLSPEVVGMTMFAGVLDDGRLCVISVGPLVTGLPVWDSGDWGYIDTSAITGGGDAMVSAAAFSEDGDLLLVLEDPNNEYVQSVHRYSGGAWETLGSAAQFPDPDTISMGFSPADDAVVCLTNPETHLVEVYQWSGAIWEPVSGFPADVFLADVTLCSEPIVSSDSVLYCLGYEITGGVYRARLMSYTGAEWASIEDQPIAGNVGQCVIVDGAGDPLVALEDDGAYMETTVCQYRDDAWEVIGMRGVTFGDVADGASMVIGTDGYLYLAYRAVGHESSAAVMRYPLE